MRRVLPVRTEAPDAFSRTMLLSVISLMLLLLPFLLLTTSAQKLTATTLRLPTAGESLPPAPPGPVEALEVALDRGALTVTADVRRTDVRAQQGESTRRVVTLPPTPDGSLDAAQLQQTLAALKELDPARTRAVLSVGDHDSAAALTALIDAVRLRQGAPLFPDVVLASGTLLPVPTPEGAGSTAGTPAVAPAVPAPGASP